MMRRFGTVVASTAATCGGAAVSRAWLSTTTSHLAVSSDVFGKRRPLTPFFDGVPQALPDPILGLGKEFAMDPDPSKVNLAVGVYRDDAGKPYTLNCVRKAAPIADEGDLEYAPIVGLASFIESAQELCFGRELMGKVGDRMASIQSLSGTGALRIGGELLHRFGGTEVRRPDDAVVYAPAPSYPNHLGIFQVCGFRLAYYPYYNNATHALRLPAMIHFLRNLPPYSMVLFHACAHNPSGCDPTQEEWRAIVEACEEARLVPFVDMAYQGFATGDPDYDAFLPRLLCTSNVPSFMVSQSLAKNFGLYGLRTGALHVICSSPNEKERVISQLSSMVRSMYSNPPIHGARVADIILRDPALRAEWLAELKAMSGRLTLVRHRLVKELAACGSVREWDHLATGIGMMGLSGLNEEQVRELKKKHHIYMTMNGRIAFSGLNNSNVERVAKAIHEVSK